MNSQLVSHNDAFCGRGYVMMGVLMSSIMLYRATNPMPCIPTGPATDDWLPSSISTVYNMGTGTS